MKERPIIFSAEMVKAVLEGRKTQTRRVVKIPEGGRLKSGTEYCPPNDTHNGGVCVCFDQSGLADFKMLPCPYGQVGDRLWVRETFMFKKGADIRESYIGTPDEGCLGFPPHYLYKADGTEEVRDYARLYKWRPSIHMPRWASRVTLEIVKVRVERLQEISEDSIKAEGVEWMSYECNSGFPDAVFYRYPDGGITTVAHAAFRALWESLNPKHPWENNDLVWVIESRLLGK